MSPPPPLPRRHSGPRTNAERLVILESNDERIQIINKRHNDDNDISDVDDHIRYIHY